MIVNVKGFYSDNCITNRHLSGLIFVLFVIIGQSITHKQLREQLLLCLPSDTEETAKCTAIVSAGARDGVTGKLECWVDGMPLETSLQVLRELRDI